MKAVTLMAPGDLRVTEHPDSPVPDGLVRVRIGAAGVCSSDVPRAHGGAYHHPLVLGHELAGTVGDRRVVVFPLLPCHACGPCAEAEYARCRDYDYFGSRRDGGFAEHLDVPEWNLLDVPDGVSLDDAALCEPTAVVIHALDRLGPGPVAVVGCGFLGLLAVALLRHSGRAVTVLGRHEAKLDRARAFGADAVAADEAWLTAHDSTFAAVLQAAGSPDSFRASLRLAAPGGSVVWMGNPEQDLALPRDAVSQLLRKEITVAGTWNSRWPGDWSGALGMMSRGLRPSVFVTETVDLDGLPALITQYWMRKQGRTSTASIKGLVTP